jgi:hypothetical protein
MRVSMFIIERIPMRKFSSGAGAFGVLLVLAATGAQAAKPYQVIDISGAGTGSGEGTMPTAISGHSVITGYYSDGNRTSHGFVGTAAKTMAAFDAPGAGTASNQGTTPTGINELGTITGSYNDGHAHGFVRHADGSFETFSVMTDTTPMAINNNDVVTGYSQFIGFVRAADGTITQFSVPGGTNTYANAINGKGVIAGYDIAASDGSVHAFVRAADGTITGFDVPGADGTIAQSIDSKGDIVGYSYGGGNRQGFLRARNGMITSFQPPGCNVYSASINFDGNIVGQCLDSSFVGHGYIRHPDGSMEIYDAPGAGTLPSAGTYPAQIGPNGKSVGYYQDNAGVNHGYRLNAGR